MLDRWRLILRYLPPYRRIVVWGFVSLTASVVMIAATPLCIRVALNYVEAVAKAGSRPDLQTVAFWAGAAVVLTVLGGLSGFFKRYLLMGVSRRLETDLRRDLFHHIQHLPRSYLDGVRTGDLLSRATADVEAVRLAAGPAMMYLADAVLRTPVVLGLMFFLNAEIAAFALLPLGGIFVTLLFMAPRLKEASRVVQDQLAEISASAQESFSGARVVKTFAMEDSEQRNIDARSIDYLHANRRLARVRGVVWASIGFLTSCGVLVIFLVGGRQAIAGDAGIGDLVAFLAYQFMLTWPMMALGFVLSMIQRGAAGLDRIREVMEQPLEVEGDADVPAVRGEIEIRGLTFGYNGDRVLSGIDLKVSAGSTLGIVGATGSGKSTLVSLLPRLYDPPPGTVFIDGRDVHEWPLAKLRAAIAAVPQEAFLYSRSVRHNITFGRQDATDDEIEAAVRRAHLTPDLEQLSEGLATVVGERGVTLSGGQKQRTSLARALAEDAPILVLDDPLSAVDTETEAAILGHLKEIGAQRTVLIVAHRISAVRDADHIVLLDEGRVAEAGTHAELVALGGAYARMTRAQELEEEIERLEL